MFFEAHGNRAGNRKEFSNYGSDSSLSAILSAFLKKNETYLKFKKKIMFTTINSLLLNDFSSANK